MKAVSSQQIQKLDQLAIQKIGIPSLVLMENAGAAVAREIWRGWRRKARLRVCLFCGTGNNGGDGLVAARHLENAGARVQIFLVGKVSALKPDAKQNYRILRKSGVRIQLRHRLDAAIRRSIAQADVLVDALFGVGLNRDLGEPWVGLIKAMNGSRKPIIAVDVPSGLDADTGNIFKVAVRARRTVTFTFAKKGFYHNSGPRHTGQVCVVDIGIPAQVKRMIA